MSVQIFFLEDDRLDSLADALRALGHPLRLRLLEALAQGESTVNGLVGLLHVPQATVSQHLKVMRNSHLVQRRREGTQAMYSLAHHGLFNLLTCLRTCQHACPASDAERRTGITHPSHHGGTP